MGYKILTDTELKDKVIYTLKGFNFDIRECIKFEVTRFKDRILCIGSFITSKDKEKVVVLDIVNYNEQITFTNLKTI